MKRTLVTSCLAWLLAACGPDLDANGAAGCDERTPCSQGASCYRGLCVPDEIDASAREPEDAEVEQGTFDSAAGSTSLGSAAERDPDDAGEVGDADEEEGTHDDAGPQDAGGLRTPEPEPDAARPATALDAGALWPVPTPAPPLDAGRRSSGSPCTLALCCDEARKAYEANQKLDGRLDAKKGKCGCGDPDLFRFLSCGSSQRPPP